MNQNYSLPEHLALTKLMGTGETDGYSIGELIKVHHILSVIYQCLLDNVSQEIQIKLSVPSLKIKLTSQSSDEYMFSIIGSALEESGFYPNGWTVEFYHYLDDCWLEDFHFPKVS